MAHPLSHLPRPSSVDILLYTAALSLSVAVVLVYYHQPLVSHNPESVYGLLKQATMSMQEMTAIENAQLR